MAKHLFQPGNPGGPGRPKKDKENSYLVAMKERFTTEQVMDAIESLLNNADSWRARHAGAELLLHYALGKPTQRIENSTTATPDDWRQAFKDDEATEVEETSE